MADFNPADDNGQKLVTVCIVFLTLTYLAVGLRVIVRVFILKSFSWDDWFMLISQAIFTISCSFILVGVHDGLGRHNQSLAVPNRILALKWQTLATITYVANMLFIKLSIAVFLLRIAVTKVYTIILKVSMAIITIWSVAIILFDVFQCSPVESQWDFTITDYHCAPGDAFVNAAYSISVMGIVSDWMYAIIPIPMIWNVQMSLQKKATVALVLSMGIFASIATLIRVQYLVLLGTYEDILYTGTDAMVWTLVEPGVAIVAASLITIRPLLRALKITGFSSGTPGDTSQRYPNSGSHALSQTLQNRSQRLGTATNSSARAGNGFELKSWNHISSDGHPETGSGGRSKSRGDKRGAGNLVRSETTVIGSSENGSQEFILQQQDPVLEEVVTEVDINRDSSIGAGGDLEAQRTRGKGSEEGITRTVVVRIHSSREELGGDFVGVREKRDGDGDIGMVRDRVDPTRLGPRMR